MKRRRGLSVGLLSVVLFALAIGSLGEQTLAWAASGGCVVRITEFEFHPRYVLQGQQAALELRAKNCTDRTQDVRLTQYGAQSSGCPVIDPYSVPASLPPHGHYLRSAPITAPPCAGAESLTVTFASADGTLLATKTASLIIARP